MTSSPSNPPGWPGIPARWTSSAKDGMGVALSAHSPVWFTLSHGILDEIYYPRIDQACTRDMGLIVTDGKSFFSEEKRHTSHQVEYLSAGVPGYRLTNTCLQGRYRIEKEIVTDPERDVVMQSTRLIPLQGKLEDYHLYVLLSPHLGNKGSGNTGWAGDYKGTPMLMAQQDSYCLALTCSAPWLKRSAGYVGTSDGWQDLSQHYQMEWTYDRAEDGNIALTGEIDLQATQGEFLLVLGFGVLPSEAGFRSLASLQSGFTPAKHTYLEQWRNWQKRLAEMKEPDQSQQGLFQISMTVLRVHEARHFPGGTIASLSIPWGDSKGDDDLGGYHLVWPRDMVESIGGLMAGGANPDAMRTLRYLHTVQEEDGHWPQNMWLDGRPYWTGIQLDEAGFPILLVDVARREKLASDREIQALWPMVKKAAGFIVRNGPVTPEDRWEEEPGYSPFTLAVEIAALLAAADLAEACEEGNLAAYLRETADYWNSRIEYWTYVTGTDLAQKYGVDGYYVRIAPPETGGAKSPAYGYVPIKNKPVSMHAMQLADHIVSPDALALVRFGLRRADDPRIVDTVQVIDATLKVETPNGPCWYRYNNDGYGEHADGTAYDGTGIGRLWPLLVGERAHYELAAGHRNEAIRLMHTMENFANSGGLIPEQVWDTKDIPDRELFFGKPSGSAMPLVWAHAEYIKLRRSLRDMKVYDTPPQTVQRYLKDQTTSNLAIWRFNNKIQVMPAGKHLRIETLTPAQLHWSPDGWKTVYDYQTEDTSLGTHRVDLQSYHLEAGSLITFTFYWPGSGKWEGENYCVEIIPAGNR